MKIYIGAYMKANGEKKISSFIEVNACANPLCVKFKRSSASKFCSECGCKIEKIKIETITKINANQLIMSKDEFIDILAPTDDYIFTPNLPNPYYRSLDQSYDEEMDLSLINIREEKEWFIMRHKDIIQYLKNELGDDNISICWGTVLLY